MSRRVVRLCWWCRHFRYWEGRPGYSEQTPTVDMAMECLKKHWRFSQYQTTEAEFRDNLMMAEICPDYRTREDIECPSE